MNFINTIKTLFLKYKIHTLNNGIEFRIVETQEEREEAFKLRYNVYCVEKKYIREENCQDGLEQDNFDKIANIFIAINKLGKVVGTLRLIPRKNDLFKERKIPLENYSEIGSFLNEESVVCELSRFTIDKDYRTRYLINFGLIKSATLFALAEGVTHFAISVSINSKNYFQKFGFKQIDEPYFYKSIQYKLPSVTMLVSIQDGLKRMRKTNISFYNYFTNK